MNIFSISPSSPSATTSAPDNFTSQQGRLNTHPPLRTPDKFLEFLKKKLLLEDSFLFQGDAPKEISSLLFAKSANELLDRELTLTTQGDNPRQTTTTLRSLLKKELTDVRAEHWHLEGGIVRSLLQPSLLLKVLRRPEISEEELGTLLEAPPEQLLDIDVCGTPADRTSLFTVRQDLISFAAKFFKMPFEAAEKMAFLGHAPIAKNRPFLVGKLQGINTPILELKVSTKQPYMFTLDQLLLKLTKNGDKIESKGTPPIQTLIDYYGRLIRAPNPDSINVNGFPRLISWMTKGFRSVDPALAKTLWNKFNKELRPSETLNSKLSSCLLNHHNDDVAVHVAYFLQTSQLLAELGSRPSDIETLWREAQLSGKSSEEGTPLQQLGEILKKHPEKHSDARALLQLVAARLYLEPDEKTGIRVTKSTKHQGKEYWEIHFNTPEPCAIFLPASPDAAFTSINSQIEKGKFSPFEWGELGQIILRPCRTIPKEQAQLERLVWQQTIEEKPSPEKVAWALSFLRAQLREKPHDFFTHLKQARDSGLLHDFPEERIALLNEACSHLATSIESKEARRSNLLALEKYRKTIPLKEGIESSLAWLTDQLYQHGEKNAALELLQSGLFDKPSEATSCVQEIILKDLATRENSIEAMETLLAQKGKLEIHPQFEATWRNILERLLKTSPRKGRELLLKTPGPINKREHLLTLAIGDDTPPLNNTETKGFYRLLIETETHAPIPKIWIQFLSRQHSDDERNIKRRWQVLLSHLTENNDSLTELHTITQRTLELTESKKIKLGAEGKRLGEIFLTNLMQKLLDAGKWKEAKQVLLQSIPCELCRLPSGISEKIYLQIAASERKTSPESAHEFTSQHLRAAVLQKCHHPDLYRELLTNLAGDAIKGENANAGHSLLEELAPLIVDDTRKQFNELHEQLARLQLKKQNYVEVAESLVSPSASQNYTPTTNKSLLLEALTLWSKREHNPGNLANFIIQMSFAPPDEKQWENLLLSVARKLVKTPHIHDSWDFIQKFKTLFGEEQLPLAHKILKKSMNKNELSLGWEIAKHFPQESSFKENMIDASSRTGSMECILALAQQPKGTPPSPKHIEGCLRHIKTLRTSRNKPEHKKALRLFCQFSTILPPSIAIELIHTGDKKCIHKAIEVLFNTHKAHETKEKFSEILDAALTLLSRDVNAFPEEVTTLLAFSPNKNFTEIALLLLEKYNREQNTTHINTLARIIANNLETAADKKNCIRLLNESRYLMLTLATNGVVPDFEKLEDLIQSKILPLMSSERLFEYYHTQFIDLLTTREPESEMLTSIILRYFHDVIPISLSNPEADPAWKLSILDKIFRQTSKWTSPKFKFCMQVMLIDIIDFGAYIDRDDCSRRDYTSVTGEQIDSTLSLQQVKRLLCKKIFEMLQGSLINKGTVNSVGEFAEKVFLKVMADPEEMYTILEEWKSLLHSPFPEDLVALRSLIFLWLLTIALSSRCQENAPLDLSPYLTLAKDLHPALNEKLEEETATKLITAIIDIEEHSLDLGLMQKLNHRNRHLIHVCAWDPGLIKNPQLVLDFINHYRRLHWIENNDGFIAQGVIDLAIRISQLPQYNSAHKRELYKNHLHLDSPFQEGNFSKKEKQTIVKELLAEGSSYAQKFHETSPMIARKIMVFFCCTINHGIFDAQPEITLELIREYFLPILPNIQNEDLRKTFLEEIKSFFINTINAHISKTPKILPQATALYLDCRDILIGKTSAKERELTRKDFENVFHILKSRLDTV